MRMTGVPISRPTSAAITTTASTATHHGSCGEKPGELGEVRTAAV